MTMRIVSNNSSRTGVSALCSLSSLSLSLPSTSTSTPSTTQTRSFHSSSPQFESRLKRISRLKKKTNLEQRQLKTTLLESTKPDPILGIQLSNSSNHNNNNNPSSTCTDPQSGPSLWLNSDLNKIILTKEQVWGLKLDRRGSLIKTQDNSNSFDSTQSELELELMKKYGGPQRLNFGLDSNPENRSLLFKDLGQIMVEDRILDSKFLHPQSPNSVDSDGETSNSNLSIEERNQILNGEMKALEEKEEEKKEVLKRILDLKNSNGRGIQRENVRRIIDHFGKRNDKGEDGGGEGKGTDTGSPEVQAALLTYRIRNLHSHLSNARHDNSNRRAMNNLVFQRAKVLKYLKREDSVRYMELLKKIGVEARAVEGEISNRIGGKPKLMNGAI